MKTLLSIKAKVARQMKIIGLRHMSHLYWEFHIHKLLYGHAFACQICCRAGGDDSCCGCHYRHVFDSRAVCKAVFGDYFRQDQQEACFYRGNGAYRVFTDRLRSVNGYCLPGCFSHTHAAAFSVNGTVNLALVAQIIPRKRMGEGIGYFGLGHIIATASGPALGLYIGERYGLSAVFLIAGTIMLSVSLMMFMLPYTEQKRKRAETSKGETTGKDRTDTRVTDRTGPRITGRTGLRISDIIAAQVLPLAFFGSVFSMFNGVIGSYLVLLGEERGIANISLYFTVNAVALILVRVTAGRVYDRYGMSAVLIPAFMLAAVAAFFIGFAKALPIILVASVIKAFAQGSAQPTIQAECIRMLPEKKSGVATSTYYLGADIGQGIGPMLAGVIASAWGYEVMFSTCAGIFLVALIAYCVSLFANGRGMQRKVESQS